MTTRLKILISILVGWGMLLILHTAFGNATESWRDMVLLVFYPFFTYFWFFVLR